MVVRWLKFNAVGALGAMLQLGVLWMLTRISVHYLLATALAVELAVLHNYAWSGNNTLRWRSRQVTDPPFDTTALTYILEYTYANVLNPSAEAYLLDHDFAFGNRSGDIEQFTLSLALDDAWRALREGLKQD